MFMYAGMMKWRSKCSTKRDCRFELQISQVNVVKKLPSLAEGSYFPRNLQQAPSREDFFIHRNRKKFSITLNFATRC